MIRLSVKLSDYLYQRLIEKSKQMGIDDNISEAIRSLLHWALENHEKNSNDALVHHAASYTLMMHCLIEECMLSLIESGSELRDKAHAKADKLIADLSEKY